MTGGVDKKPPGPWGGWKAVLGSWPEIWGHIVWGDPPCSIALCLQPEFDFTDPRQLP